MSIRKAWVLVLLMGVVFPLVSGATQADTKLFTVSLQRNDVPSFTFQAGTQCGVANTPVTLQLNQSHTTVWRKENGDLRSSSSFSGQVVVRDLAGTALEWRKNG